MQPLVLSSSLASGASISGEISCYARPASAFSCLCAAAGYLFSRIQIELLTTAELQRSILRSPQPPPMAFVRPLIETRLDFKSWSVYRSDSSVSSRPQPVPLRHGHLSVQILLPLFSLPGQYQVTLRRDAAAPIVDQTIRARIRSGETVLDRIEVDTTTAPPGVYRLVVRREGASAVRANSWSVLTEGSTRHHWARPERVSFFCLLPNWRAFITCDGAGGHRAPESHQRECKWQNAAGCATLAVAAARIVFRESRACESRETSKLHCIECA